MMTDMMTDIPFIITAGRGLALLVSLKMTDKDDKHTDIHEGIFWLYVSHLQSSSVIPCHRLVVNEQGEVSHCDICGVHKFLPIRPVISDFSYRFDEDINEV